MELILSSSIVRNNIWGRSKVVHEFIYETRNNHPELVVPTAFEKNNFVIL